MVLAEAANPLLDPWRFQAHAEVWLLVAFLIGARVYAIRVIGPHAEHLRRGEPVVTRRQNWLFAAAIAVLWIASDWPIHDIAEEYLYSVHMFQHMALSYFLPPLALLATPAWLFRALFDTPVVGRMVRWFAHPVIAGFLYNVVVLVTHIPALVNQSASNGPLHYTLHVLVVTSSLLMWIPVVSPEPSASMRQSVKGLGIQKPSRRPRRAAVKSSQASISASDRRVRVNSKPWTVADWRSSNLGAAWAIDRDRRS